MAHACNPSYSRGRDQEDCGSKPSWANSSQDPISKNHITKNWLVEWLKVKVLSSSLSTAKKKKKKKKGGRGDEGEWEGMNLIKIH
jgi:hypothetical protein